MEASGRGDARGISAEDVWNESVADAAAAAAQNPLDVRFGPPERWPGYYLIRQRALASAAEASERPIADSQRRRQNSQRNVRGVERTLEARSGQLAGRPDHFNGDTITEYKSSLPDPDWSGAQRMLDEFRRQLRLYAVIIAEANGKWPTRGRIVSASGQVMEVPLLEADCVAEADSALESLHALNRALASGSTPETVATPSPIACGACPFKILCPAFWRWMKNGKTLDGSEVSAEADLCSIEMGQDGDLYTARLALRSASHEISSEQRLVLRRSVHGDLAVSSALRCWRIVSAKAKPDGCLRADLSTVVFDLSAIPTVVVV